MAHLHKILLGGRAELLRKGSSGRHNEFDAVANDQCVVQEIPRILVLQHRALHKLPIAVAVPRIRILQCLFLFSPGVSIALNALSNY